MCIRDRRILLELDQVVVRVSIRFEQQTRGADTARPVSYTHLLQQQMSAIAGQKIAVFQPPSLPGALGLPIQFAIKTTEPPARLNEVSQEFLAEAVKSGLFMFIDTDLKFDLPQSVIEIDRDKTAQLGLTMTQVGNSLGSLLGGNYVNYFNMDTRSYKVIPQVERGSRLNVDQLMNYPVATAVSYTHLCTWD